MLYFIYQIGDRQFAVLDDGTPKMIVSGARKLPWIIRVTLKATKGH